MTLHWWMHWFWVTTLLALMSVTSCYAHPQEERRAKAMYPQSKPFATTPRLAESKLNVESLHDRKLSEKSSPQDERTDPSTRGPDNATTATLPSSTINTTLTANVTEPTVTWNRTEVNSTLSSNDTALQNVTEKESWPVEAGTEELPSHAVTEKPWSLETTLLERADNGAHASRERAPRRGEGMDAGAIAGISFAALALATLAGSVAFVMYRRRYLNKPQTLNDKCSNPDSSGYLDDSTIRDNSEEMYSLDNDSFLNSLEAMTIQNYWTDVKHSKL